MYTWLYSLDASYDFIFTGSVGNVKVWANSIDRRFDLVQFIKQDNLKNVNLVKMLYEKENGDARFVFSDEIGRICVYNLFRKDINDLGIFNLTKCFGKNKYVVEIVNLNDREILVAYNTGILRVYNVDSGQIVFQEVIDYRITSLLRLNNKNLDPFQTNQETLDKSNINQRLNLAILVFGILLSVVLVLLFILIFLNVCKN